MSFAYIGVAVVAVLLIGFVMLSIFWAIRSVGTGIRNKTLDILSEYDSLVELNSQKLARMKEEERTVGTASVPQVVQRVAESAPVTTGVAPMFIMNTAERISTTVYQDRSVGKLYTQVRNAFRQSPEEIYDQLPNQGAGGDGGAATRLLVQLEFDTIFELATLEPDTQRELLSQVIEPEALPILEAYGATTKAFNGLEFYRYLQDTAQLEPRPTVVRVPVGQVPKTAPANSVVIEDEELCEGMEIEVGNLLYDFCIKAREIG